MHSKSEASIDSIATQKHNILDIAVIGAGIAGLSAAIGLTRAGHRVEIYERSKFSNEVGAAIHVCPNAARILSQWQFDFERADAVVVREGNVLDAATLTASYRSKYNNLHEVYGAHWYFVHRVDLHSELKRLATNPGPDYSAATINLSTEVVGADACSGTLLLKDGTKIVKDLVIAADGVHSVLSPIVQGDVAQAFETGQSAFRFLIPTEKLRDIGKNGNIFKPHPAALSIATDNTRRLVFYPCRGGKIMNFVGIHPSRDPSEEKEEWHSSASLEDLIDEYKSFHPDLVEACRRAEDLKLWKLLYRHPNQNWYKGKIALAGDAVHPMLPHQGQGGAQAIEDGAALGVLLAGLASKDELGDRLFMYQEVRRNRAASMQVLSNAGQEEAYKVQAHARKYISGHVPTNPDEFHKYNFSHDVRLASARMLIR